MSDAIKSRRFYLPTEELIRTPHKFGSNVPAFNNTYDVFINFAASGKLKNFIEKRIKHFNTPIGPTLALFCSEALLPGTSLDTSTVDGLRQGMSQQYATFRRFPDITLTWYTQQNYMTNDVFNSWVEFISPNTIETPLTRLSSFRKMRYPNEYKCPIEITAFSRDVFNKSDRLGREENPVRKRVTPSTITYFIEQAFPVSIIASPLAYGTAQLIKTSVTFKYENYAVERTSRTADILDKITKEAEADSDFVNSILERTNTLGAPDLPSSIDAGLA